MLSTFSALIYCYFFAKSEAYSLVQGLHGAPV